VTVSDNRKSRLLALGAALLFYVVFIFRTSFVVQGTRYFVLFEDAMISMRYAKHFADGNGLTWNVGEPPIEGFTNLLWTLWMSVGHMLGLSESKVSLFIMLSGIAILLGNGFVASKIARKLSDSPWVPLAVLVAVLFDYPLVFWTLRGMEVGALSLVVYTLLWLVLENEEKFSLARTALMSLLTGAALLLRSDSVVPIALIGLYGLYTAEKRVLFLVTMGVGPVVALGGQFISRDRYFHEKLPNTYYLKLGHIPLSARLKRGSFVALDVLALHLAVPLACIAARAMGIDRDRARTWIAAARAVLEDRAKRRKFLLGAMFFAQIAYATYVGGDAWEWMLYANRYMCVGMPALILLVAAVLAEVVAFDRAKRIEYTRRFSTALVGFGALLLVLNIYAKKWPEHGIAATIVFSKTPFAFGGAYVGLGLLLKMKDSARGMVDGLAAIGQRLATKATASRAAVILMAFVWLPCHLLPLGRWAAQNAAQYADEARYTRLGLLLRATTPDDFRIAVAAAGATPYFSGRPTEELLGKNDRVIARLAPRGVFSPGHDKWDYHYSLGERKSQLIVEAVDTNPDDMAYMESLGFEQLPNEMRVRKDAVGIKRDLLGTDVPDAATLAGVLESASYTLPPPLSGRDIGVILAFCAGILLLFRASVRDVDEYKVLADAPPETDTPAEEPLPAGKDWGIDAHQIPTLDGMRGIAVLAVLAFHFAWTFPGEDPGAAHGVTEKLAVHLHDFLWSGWTGVDLFFVLSGFLITRGLVTPSKKPLGTRMKMFWMRRVLRIFPLYYAVVIVGTIVCLAIGGWTPSLPYWLYMQNYALAFDNEVMRWTAHFWSLAIEEQFYFVWPIVALASPKRRLIPIILLVILACVMLRAGITMKGHFWDELTIKKFVYRATFTRCDGLLMGALVAVLQREHDHPLSYAWRRMRWPVFVATALALLGLYALAHGLNDYDRRVMVVGYFLLAVFFASGVSLCADGVIGERARGILSSRPLVACGKVSYGMYIFHWPLVVWLVPRIEKMQEHYDVGARIGLGLGLIVGATAVIYVCAAISYRVFESPFLRLKGKFHG
jgi:peptidoglycan/LPS O-acetylase OafA/YrhL